MESRFNFSEKLGHTETEIRDAIEQLASVGEIYSTIDEGTWLLGQNNIRQITT